MQTCVEPKGVQTEACGGLNCITDKHGILPGDGQRQETEFLDRGARRSCPRTSKSRLRVLSTARSLH